MTTTTTAAAAGASHCRRHSSVSWRRTFSSMILLSLTVLSSSSLNQASAAPSTEFITSPSRYTTWNLGETVNIRFRRSLSKNDSNNTMLYLEYTTRACRGSLPDEERYCDNRATKISAFGQVPSGADSFQWTIPTTLDLQLSRGKFHIYDYNGHTSESFTIRPAPRRYPKIGMVDQGRLF
ncbi:hypothetical protein BC939DRAFT_499862 [Gamsiella multidivaricata]|uniref:uncharacterized protein n=1 Tax=Gamsiella multidivaricata TaxID=101098 RepID=UPI00221E99A7|nr:uncharacterized protein BC939DRAFT_499862 [Gamsiella multidivaricata]KAI7829735.1 hypothetical protein BC939DRAFT_499862 [Gamsiella multidivaricata]